MNPKPNKMVSAEEIWKGLTADSRQSVCNILASHSGPHVGARFADLVESEHRKQLAKGSTTQMVTNGKRKLDDIDVARPFSKKPRLIEATAGLNTIDVNFAQLALRQPSVPSGQPTFSPTTIQASPNVASPSPAMPSTAGRENPINPPTSFAATKPSLFGQTTPVKPETPPKPLSDCDEQFTFADRRSFGPQTSNGPGNTHGNRPSAQNDGSGKASAPSPAPPPQSSFCSATVSTVYKPPFAGVDMSSLKVPANSNVNLTMNVFQAPSSLYQTVDSGTPRKLKCIQCKEYYIETQNTTKECHRHTGRCLDVEDEKFYNQGLPRGAYRVWDCCRRTIQSRGCYPCNHYAG